MSKILCLLLVSGALSLAQDHPNFTGDWKLEGESGQVSMYYNGPVLVELDMNGDHVTKKRLHLAADGKAMEMEVVPISPPGASEKLVFAKTDAQPVDTAS